MKPLRFCFSTSLLLAAMAAHAVVIRHDVQNAKYVVSNNDLPALVDLPMEGHGVLIAKQWVVTAAHATLAMRTISGFDYVVINGKRRHVEKIVLYPDYATSLITWNELFKKMKSMGVTAWMAEYASDRASMHDIALIELSVPVEDVRVADIYRRQDEQGRIAEIYGKGATGSDLHGADPKAPHRGELRKAYNRITSAENQWLVYTFDCGAKALPLEGVVAGGDSGGPLLIKDDGVWKLAGLAHGLDGNEKDVLTTRAGTFRQGICGQNFSNSRISFYADWIDSVLASTGEHSSQ